MTGTKRSYVAPEVNMMQFDAKDVLTTSGGNWSFDCQQQGEGSNRDWDTCSVIVTTDNSTN